MFYLYAIVGASVQTKLCAINLVGWLDIVLATDRYAELTAKARPGCLVTWVCFYGNPNSALLLTLRG